MKAHLIWILFIAYANAFSSGDFNERYIGVLTHDARQVQQLTKLDIVSYYVGASQRYFVTFTMYFGGFDSDEYITHAYNNVRYDRALRELILVDSREDVRLKIRIVSKDHLEATVTSSLAGPIGNMTLYPDSTPLVLSLPVISRLAGRYETMCNKRAGRLLLQTYRSPDTDRYGNPFHAMQIKGQLGAQIAQMCGEQNYCVINQIITGSYNFYDAYVNLSGSHGAVDCTVSRLGALNCGGCEYRKDSEATVTSIWQLLDPFTGKYLASEKIEGKAIDLGEIEDTEYQGYLFHENRKIYQSASLHFNQHKHGGVNKNWFSLSAVLYFGSCLSSEKIPYRYNEQEVNRVPFLFENLAYDSDAVIRVDHITPDEVRGVWYSKIFGRIGPFYLRKAADIQLPLDAVAINEIGTLFDSDGLLLDLHTFQKSGFYRHENPFALVGLAGYFLLKDVTSTRFIITGSSYDFYTGKIAVELEGGLRASSGIVTADQEGLDLRWTSMGFAFLMIDDTPIRFHRVHTHRRRLVNENSNDLFSKFL